MATPDESKIDYVDKPISGSIEGLGYSVPRVLGYDWDDEKLLDSSVLDVRQVSASSATTRRPASFRRAGSGNATTPTTAKPSITWLTTPSTSTTPCSSTPN